MKIKQPITKNTKEENSIVQAMAKFLPYWPLFLVFLIFSMTSAFFYVRYTVPQYEASAAIIIKDEKKGYDDSKMMESLDLINTKKISENEIEVLQSNSIMTSVVKKLHLYAPITQDGKVKSLSAYTSSPLTIEAFNTDSMKKVDKVSLDYDEKNATVILNKNYRAPINKWLNTPFFKDDDEKNNTTILNKSYSYPINKWVNTPFGKLRFLPNNKYIPYGDNDKPLYFSILPVKNVAEVLSLNLKVNASSKLSSVINLIYKDEVPRRAEDILNEIMISYSDAALNEKNNLAKKTLSFIEERLAIVSRDLDSIEGKLQQYKTGKGAVDIGRQGQLYLENVSTNDKRLRDLNMQADALNQLEKSASASGNLGSLPSTLGINDPALTQQMNNLNTLQMQYDKLKMTVGENNPILVSIAEQINQIKPTILSNIQSQQKNLEQSKGNLYATGGTYNSILSSIPQKERQLVEITRDQNVKNGIYSFLLQKREESELSYASNISDSRVVNYAQASNVPVSPKRMIIYLASLALALGMPVIFINAKEILSPKILYRNEIESLSEVPVIGEVSFNATKEGLVIKAGVRTFIAEEFRKIRVSLLSLGINSDHKKILVTSSISGEGKSFIAANLATSISLTGKRVVLVDIDLHNPGLRKYFSIHGHPPGVCDYLIGEKSIDDIILKIPDNDNLFYISSGTLQPDSSELLENGKVKTLIAQLDADYDVVVIDAAPIVLITDAYLLSSLCDATLYVVRHKFTPKMLVKRIDESMVVNPIKNPAIIFNGVKTRGFLKNDYGYGYNYVYSYDNIKKKTRG